MTALVVVVLLVVEKLEARVGRVESADMRCFTTDDHGPISEFSGRGQRRIQPELELRRS